MGIEVDILDKKHWPGESLYKLQEVSCKSGRPSTPRQKTPDNAYIGKLTQLKHPGIPFGVTAYIFMKLHNRSHIGGGS